MQSSENSELFLGKPGITGLWYLENIEKNDSVENRRLDLFYAKNQNIWLDLEIIGKTIAKTLSRRGKNG
jgi:undecaprenyl-phosphate galactose phosphotransferase